MTTYQLVIPKKSIDKILAHFKRTKTRSVDMWNDAGTKRTFYLKNAKLYAKSDDGIEKEVEDGESMNTKDLVPTSVKAVFLKKFIDEGMSYGDAVNAAIDVERMCQGLCPISDRNCGHPACCGDKTT